MAGKRRSRNLLVKQPSRQINRRMFLGGAAGVAAGAIFMPAIARAQAKRVLFWTSQSATQQRTAYAEIIKKFEAANPDQKVEIEFLGSEALWAKLSAAFAAKQLPDLLSNVQAPYVAQLAEADLVEPFDDVVKAVGESDFYPISLKFYKNPKKGFYTGVASNRQTTAGNLWYRTDLFADAGLNPPKRWDDFLVVAKKLTTGGVYGAVTPFGKTHMAGQLFEQLVWEAGGFFLNPDLSVAFNSPEVMSALEFFKELAQYTPPGSANYGYAETLSGFVTGRVATAPYTGRVIATIAEENPKLVGKFAVVPYPYSPTGRYVSETSASAFVTPKGAQNPQGGKLFAQWMLRKESMVAFTHATPGHELPTRKSVQDSPEYLGLPLFEKHRDTLKVLDENTNFAANLVQESDKHAFNSKAGALWSSLLLPELIQDMMIGQMPVKQVAAKGADRIAAIMKG